MSHCPIIVDGCDKKLINCIIEHNEIQKIVLINFLDAVQNQFLWFYQRVQVFHYDVMITSLAKFALLNLP